jgi:ABC-type oligopeptide transport system substrate-binding subunit
MKIEVHMERRRPIVWLGLLWLTPAIVLLGCRQVDEEPEIVTQVVMVAGEEVVVTQVVRHTVEVAVAVTPVIEEPERPIVLDISYDGTYSTLDPQFSVEDNAVDLIENIFAGLTRYNYETDMVEPMVASSWEVSEDGRTWTFQLRDDIFWVDARRDESGLLPSQGSEVRPVRPVVAEDFVYAIQRACDPRRRAPDAFILFVIDGCERAHRRETVSQADLIRIGARALDERTLEVTLGQPSADFLTITSTALMRPVPVEHVLEMREDEWHLPANILTNGPFIVSPQTLAGTRTVLQRNPFWPIPFRGNIDTVNILHLDDDMDALLLWENRDLDLSPVPEEEQSRILNRYALRTDLVSSQDVFYVSYNFESPVFGLAEVRQAFGWAIDRERLVREVHGDRAQGMRHFAPPGVFGAPAIDEVGVGYSPDRARQAMDASPFGDCRLMPPVTYLVTASDVALQQAELLREMWMEELGCAQEQIIIEQMRFGSLLSATRADSLRRPDIWDLGWSSYYPDENNWVGDVLHCLNSENRQKRPCSEADELIQAANTVSSQEERWELYRQVERTFFGEEAVEPISPLFVRANYALRQGWLAYSPAHFGGEQYDTYLINDELKQLERSR